MVFGHLNTSGDLMDTAPGHLDTKGEQEETRHPETKERMNKKQVKDFQRKFYPSLLFC